MRYLKSFNNVAKRENYKWDDSNTPNVSLIEGLEPKAGGLSFTREILRNYSKDYFAVVALEDTIFDIDFTIVDDTLGNLETGYIQYSLDNGKTWSEQYGALEGINVKGGKKVLLKGIVQTYPSGVDQPSDIPGHYIKSNKKYKVEGNIMSIFYGDNFENQHTMVKEQILSCFFFKDTKLVDASNLILPATEFPQYGDGDRCFENMFSGCTSLIYAPKVLPALTLENECYQFMFENCTSLRTVPQLPATILADYCYYGMFKGCTSLVSVPSDLLQVTSLFDKNNEQANNCYGSMFSGCTSLIAAPELPAYPMSASCYEYMFEDCTSLTTAPDLLAPTLVEGCYNRMFKGCTSLNYIKCLGYINTSYSLTEWVKGVSETGTFVKVEGDYLTTGDSGIPEGWTVISEEIPYDPSPNSSTETDSGSNSGSGTF